MKLYKGILDPEDVNPSIKRDVKNFILSVSRNEDAYWPGVSCVIWGDGRPLYIYSGDRYSESNTEIYLRHRPTDHTPIWVIGVLSAIAQQFRMDDDPEVRSAILQIATNMASGIFKMARDVLAQSFNGTPIVHLAVNLDTNTLAGQYPATDEDLSPVWREAINGNPVNIEAPGWAPFILSS
jgi:hypothetical protein